MTIVNIKVSLQKLHTTLESSDAIDSELKELLQTLDTDIQNLLKKYAADAAATVPEAELRSELVERAQGISVRLAIGHPHLEPVLREIADTLTNMGI